MKSKVLFLFVMASTVSLAMDQQHAKQEQERQRMVQESAVRQANASRATNRPIGNIHNLPARMQASAYTYNILSAPKR